MATFYVGVRPVLRGRNYNNFIHPQKGTVGVYSNWSLMDTGGQILTGAPDNEYVLGTAKHARILEYIAAGKPHIAPLKGPGDGARLDGGRFSPLEYKGTVPAFPSGYGHADRVTSYSLYSNYVFDGVPSADPLKDAGHAIRYNVSYGGAFKPYIHNGVGSAVLSDPGQAIPAGNDNDYGHNRVNEWAGVPSARAL